MGLNLGQKQILLSFWQSFKGRKIDNILFVSREWLQF